MEVSPTFIAHPSELELLYFLRRRLQDGEIVPWIHAANIYGGDPVAMTAQYAPATAANGKRAWYFVCTPEQKQPKDPRIKRVAGAGTWKGERGWPLVSVSGNGVNERVGWKRTFSYLIKAEGMEETATRLGWTMLEIKLSDGTAACLCKIYQPRRSYKHKIAEALNLSLMPQESSACPALSSSPAIASAAATSSTTAPLRDVSSLGSTLGPSTQMASGSIDAAAAGVYMAVTSPSSEAARTRTTVPTSPSASPAATPPPSASPAATQPYSSLAPRSNAATVETSPPKRWVQVQISDSPTKAAEKSLGRPKRVYMVLPGDEGLDSPSAKKLKPIECKGWLTIEPMHGVANSVA